ncbi:zinc-dependent metalloprotease [Pedobacter sp. PLR]|uniref:zinc-dependent metalloprotease n=1 Tax=Pedobacter sp. PLR TaxID=2994465 RepID=UPI002246B0B4|nr:zinc-dependent metalloprotease [Pedobacter sp. PLR]MCX2452456.1 zinc-dependent metalloprotease [Pedobacter sp. PLR]
MKLKFVPFLFALFAFETGFAQDSAAVKKPAIAKLKAYKDIISAKAISKSGLFKVHKVDDRYYFEIPDSVLKAEFLFTTRLSKVATGSPRFGGEMMNAMIVSFEKAPNDKLFVRAITNVAQSNGTDMISRALRNATVDPIIMVLDLKARGVDNKSSVVEFTDFFLKDNLISGFNAEAKKQMGTGAAAADRSMILSMNAFPGNIEVKSLKTYSMGAAAPKPGEDAAAPSASVGVTFEISNSVMVMPEKPMAVQVFDPRVGYYSGSYQVFSDEQQEVDLKRFIVRNRLEVKPQDMARYKAGTLVEPKEPLVYYIDPATPKQWRKYIIAGINDWNEAFKSAGFKNAIVGKEWPENDPAMSLEDARYRVVRYFPSASPFTVNPRLNDPRTGEILQSYIGWSHSQIKTLHDWYMVQAGAADPNGRSMKFSNELMGALIRAQISRNVGFTLGLRENLGSSSTIPLAQLRDKKWLESHPFNHSIMDVNYYNYVAQPEDQISRKGLIPGIGDYDKWAIKWGYTYTGAKDFESDRKIRLKWILDNVKPGSKLWFGPDQNTNPSDPVDPNVQWEDLGNDPVKASEYGLKNLKVVMANLLKWTTTNDGTYYNTSDLYYTLCDQFSFITRRVYSNVGGVYTTIKSIEQEGDVYAPVPRATQKAAVEFLNKELFNTPLWIFDQQVLNKFRKPAKKEQYQKMQDNALSYLISPARLFRMNNAAMRYGKAQVYSIDELFTDLNKGMWAELKTRQPVDSYKRILQKSQVAYMIKSAQDGDKLPDLTKPGLEELAGTDVPVILRAHLKTMMDQCNAALPNYTDPVMVGHLKYISAKIDKFLDLDKK